MGRATYISAGRATYISLALRRTTGAPYMAYADDANSGRMTVMNFTGSAWSCVGPCSGFSQAQATCISLTLHPNTSVPWVAYADYYYINKVVLMTYNASKNAWSAVGSSTGVSAGAVASVTVALHPTTGIPSLAYIDLTTAGNNKGAVLISNGVASNGATTWTTYQVPTNQGVSGLSMVLHPTTGLPWVSYVDQNNSNSVAVQFWSATSNKWLYPYTVYGSSTSINPYIATQSTYTSLALHPTTYLPYVAFSDTKNSNKASSVQGIYKP